MLQALGIAAFDSGLGVAEEYSWADQVRPPVVKASADEKRGGGPGKRVYVEQLLATLPAAVYAALLRVEGVRGRLVCDLGCCRLTY